MCLTVSTNATTLAIDEEATIMLTLACMSRCEDLSLSPFTVEWEHCQQVDEEMISKGEQLG